MRLPNAFSPMEPGEQDTLVFDFTADAGAAEIVSTSWTCTLAPYQVATDPNPSDRIISVAAANKVQRRDPITGALITKYGSFSVAVVGSMPISALGAIYVLEATVMLNDGRVLKLNSTILCSNSTA
jgi:hypothetical protein